MEKLLNVNEIFHSIQGEGTRAGRKCVFVRLQGCMLRCNWCDTPYALELRQKEKMLTISDIVSQVKGYNTNFVQITGGEPLAQENSIFLMSKLCDMGYLVALETNGHSDVSSVDKRVIKIMDIKCLASGMSKFNNYNNIEYLTQQDEVKFVIANDEDFDWAKGKVEEYQLDEKVNAVIFSPAFRLYQPEKLAEMVLKTDLKIMMQIQIHKYIWHPSKRGV